MWPLTVRPTHVFNHTYLSSSSSHLHTYTHTHTHTHTHTPQSAHPEWTAEQVARVLSGQWKKMKPEKRVPYQTRSHVEALRHAQAAAPAHGCSWAGCGAAFDMQAALQDHAVARHAGCDPMQQLQCEWEGCGAALLGCDAMAAHLSEAHIGLALVSLSFFFL